MSKTKDAKVRLENILWGGFFRVNGMTCRKLCLSSGAYGEPKDMPFCEATETGERFFVGDHVMVEPVKGD